MSKNANLHKAKAQKNDEFYTQLSDVSKELSHYGGHFRNKIVLCNCNDTVRSAFWTYFHLNFERLELKKLISTSYDKENTAYKMEYRGGNDGDISQGMITGLQGNGDFRNDECIELLREADVIVTNPPFSLFREYVAQLMAHEKKFLIIGNLNAVKYAECFPLIMQNKMWLGNNYVQGFIRPDGTTSKFGNVTWFTNMDLTKRHERINLWKRYHPAEYPTYDTYDAIEVSKVSEIPSDFDGIMGVPISFVNKYCSDQFEIVGEFNHGSDNKYDLAKPVVNGKEMFPRIAIRKKRFPKGTVEDCR